MILRLLSKNSTFLQVLWMYDKNAEKKGTASPSKCRKMPCFGHPQQPARPAWGIYEWRGADLQKPKGWTLMVGTWISCWARPSFQGLLMMPYMFFFREAFKESSPQKLSKVEFTFFRPVDQRPTDNFSQFLNFFDLTKHARERSKVPKKCQSFEPNIFLQMSWYVQESICATTWKINMEPTSHPFRKENDLPNLHDYVPC